MYLDRLVVYKYKMC